MGLVLGILLFMESSIFRRENCQLCVGFEDGGPDTGNGLILCLFPAEEGILQGSSVGGSWAPNGL